MIAMAVTTALDGDSQPRRLMDVLRQKAKLSEEEIKEFFATADGLDLVEYVMALEERFRIEICDEDFLDFDPGEDGLTGLPRIGSDSLRSANGPRLTPYSLRLMALRQVDLGGQEK